MSTDAACLKVMQQAAGSAALAGFCWTDATLELSHSPLGTLTRLLRHLIVLYGAKPEVPSVSRAPGGYDALGLLWGGVPHDGELHVIPRAQLGHGQAWRQRGAVEEQVLGAVAGPDEAPGLALLAMQPLHLQAQRSRLTLKQRGSAWLLTPTCRMPSAFTDCPWLEHYRETTRSGV